MDSQHLLAPSSQPGWLGVSLDVGDHSLWVANGANDAVAQLSESTGDVVQVLVGTTSTVP